MRSVPWQSNSCLVPCRRDRRTTREPTKVPPSRGRRVQMRRIQAEHFPSRMRLSRIAIRHLMHENDRAATSPHFLRSSPERWNSTIGSPPIRIQSAVRTPRPSYGALPDLQLGGEFRREGPCCAHERSDLGLTPLLRTVALCEEAAPRAESRNSPGSREAPLLLMPPASLVFLTMCSIAGCPSWP